MLQIDDIARPRLRENEDTAVKIMVVEDDPNLQLLWEEVFTSAGHVTRSVASAVEARKILLTESFDLLLLDLCLGEDSGLSVATMGTYANPDCKVVIITGSTLFPMGELFDMSASISAVLRKPVDIEELLAVCEHFLQTSPQQHAKPPTVHAEFRE